MPRIHVCPLPKIADVAEAIGARTLVTLINVGTPVPRPPQIEPERHLFIGMSDIVAPEDGHILPHDDHVATLIDFVRTWDRVDPLLIHCYAGVSRSTAAAFISACALAPDVPEQVFAQRIRVASPTATPNARLVALADERLGRGGRMVEAIASIGRGVDCSEGVPFGLHLTPDTRSRPA